LRKTINAPLARQIRAAPPAFLLPNRDRWYGRFQEHVTGSLALNAAAFGGSLDQCRHHLSALFAERPQPLSFTVLELGTGWYPILPVAMYLCGATDVWTYDIAPLLRADRVRKTLEFFREFSRDERLQKHLPWLLSERVAMLDGALKQSAPDAMLAAVRVHVRLAMPAHRASREYRRFLFFAFGVQYIPLPAIDGLLAEFRRIARPGAVHSHHIYCGDHLPSSTDTSVRSISYAIPLPNGSGSTVHSFGKRVCAFPITARRSSARACRLRTRMIGPRRPTNWSDCGSRPNSKITPRMTCASSAPG
jgi:hypothetical protein